LLYLSTLVKSVACGGALSISLPLTSCSTTTTSIDHHDRLYPETFSFLLKAQTKKEDLFVPSGWDAADLIEGLVSSKVNG